VRPSDDTGSVSVMIVGFFFVIGLMVAAVVDASAAYLRHQELSSIADGAALNAADGVQGEHVYTGGLGQTATVDPAAAQRFVADYLAASGATQQMPGLTWEVTPVGDTVSVRLSAPLNLPLDPPGWTASTTVVAEAAVVVQVD
jgi:uncharacterized membrane protein